MEKIHHKRMIYIMSMFLVVFLLIFPATATAIGNVDKNQNHVHYDNQLNSKNKKKINTIDNIKHHPHEKNEKHSQKESGQNSKEKAYQRQKKQSLPEKITSSVNKTSGNSVSNKSPHLNICTRPVNNVRSEELKTTSNWNQYLKDVNETRIGMTKTSNYMTVKNSINGFPCQTVESEPGIHYMIGFLIAAMGIFYLFKKRK